MRGLLLCGKPCIRTEIGYTGGLCNSGLGNGNKMDNATRSDKMKTGYCLVIRNAPATRQMIPKSRGRDRPSCR